LASRAASSEATTVDEEVTFYPSSVLPPCKYGPALCRNAYFAVSTYNGGDGELLLASVLEQTEDIVANDNARLAAQDIGDAHGCGFWRGRFRLCRSVLFARESRGELK
jgi:hypothetical protein